MFRKRRDILEEPKIERVGFPPVVKLVSTVGMGVWLTASAVTDYMKDRDREKFVSTMKANEMFCRAPQFGDDFRGDPYDVLLDTALGGQRRMVSVPFDYNEADLKSRREEIRAQLKDVIDDPNVTFIIAGHASYDLDSKYPFLGIQTPEGFEDEHARHMRNNFKMAAKRIAATRELLLSLGVDEGRIIKEINHGVRYDKREVDIDVCVPVVLESG